MARLVLFDVNETLLDLSVLDGPFEEVMGDAYARHEWFARALQLSTVLALLGKYVDFADVSAQALDKVAASRGLSPDPALRGHVLGRMRALPVHDDVFEALDLLEEAGVRRAALTNSGLGAARAVLDQAGIADRFEQILSVESVARFKPAAEPYQDAAERLGVDIADIRLVAAHDWDCAGALAAGATAAWVNREGTTYAPALAPPDLDAPDLVQLARLIISVDHG